MTDAIACFWHVADVLHVRDQARFRRLSGLPAQPARMA